MFNLRRTPFSSITAGVKHSTIGGKSAEHTVRDGLDFGGRADGFVGGQTALGVDQVGSKDGVDESRFP